MNKTNKFKLRELIDICDVIKTHVSDEDCIFDYLRIVSLGKEYETKNYNILFFPIYFTEYDIQDSWMPRYVDLRPKIAEIMAKHPEYTYIVETNMLSLFDNDKYQYIVVNNLYDAIDKLYTYQLNKIHPQVIAVTGSVGKTTCVGLIEKVLSTQYKVHRIYHKRITPILLKAHIINLLVEGIEIITLENSIYYKDHVKVLSTILKPDIACFITLNSEHLYKDGMNTIEDLAVAKAEIFRHAKIGFYNEQNEYIKKLHLQDNVLYFANQALFATSMSHLQPFMTNKYCQDDKFILDKQIIKPYLLSQLSLIQYSLAYELGLLFQINQQAIINALNEYVPVEKRLTKCQLFGKNVLFDGDISSYERLKQLSNNHYQNKILVIRKFGSAEEIEDYSHVPELFANYDYVYLFDDIAYLNLLNTKANTIVVHNHDFLNNYSGHIFYHYSGYFRDYDKVTMQNLLDIKNDAYKIILTKGGKAK